MATVRKRTWESGGKTRSAFVADYFDQNGKRRSKQFKKAGDAKDWLAKTVHEVKEGIHTPDSVSITVAEASALWLKKCEAEQLEPTTLRQYRGHVARHIVPAIGRIKLARLTMASVQVFRDQLVETCPSRATARKVLTSFKSILTEAMSRGLVAQNVAGAVRIKKDDRDRAIAIPSKEEVRQILDNAGQWYALLLTAASTGMRASELRGLTWENVDFDKNLIHVRQRADEAGTIGPPKSRAGTRDIPMTPEVKKTLLERKLASKRKRDADFVFCTLVGTVERYSSMTRRGFEPAQRAAGIIDKEGNPKYGLHSLRHFFASWVIENFTPKEAQSFLGHASIVLTYDIYGHLFPGQKDHHEKFAQAAQTFSRS